MKTNTEKIVKPLKKVKAAKQQNEDAVRSMKPAVRIQELKNKLIILGHELFATKKINESLYRKLQLITYSRTTEQKLKDSYKNLKILIIVLNNLNHHQVKIKLNQKRKL